MQRGLIIATTVLLAALLAFTAPGAAEHNETINNATNASNVTENVELEDHIIDRSNDEITLFLTNRADEEKNLTIEDWRTEVEQNITVPPGETVVHTHPIDGQSEIKVLVKGEADGFLVFDTEQTVEHPNLAFSIWGLFTALLTVPVFFRVKRGEIP